MPHLVVNLHLEHITALADSGAPRIRATDARQFQSVNPLAGMLALAVGLVVTVATKVGL